VSIFVRYNESDGYNCAVMTSTKFQYSVTTMS